VQKDDGLAVLEGVVVLVGVAVVFRGLGGEIELVGR
jgi:hypothetical protein